jgi:hypothetical protein
MILARVGGRLAPSRAEVETSSELPTRCRRYPACRHALPRALVIISGCFIHRALIRTHHVSLRRQAGTYAH